MKRHETRSQEDLRQEVLASLKIARMYAVTKEAEAALAWICAAEAEARDWLAKRSRGGG